MASLKANCLCVISLPLFFFVLIGVSQIAPRFAIIAAILAVLPIVLIDVWIYLIRRHIVEKGPVICPRCGVLVNREDAICPKCNQRV